MRWKPPKFHPMVWILLFGYFFSRTGYYMVWPFFAVVLKEKFGMSAMNIGLILGVEIFVGCLVSFYAGNLSDRFGRNNIIYFALVVYTATFTGLATADSVILFLFFSVLVGICNALFEAPARAFLADLTPEQDLRELAINARYFCANLGTILGPLIGIWLGLTAQAETFFVTAGIYFGFLFILILGFIKYPIGSAHEAMLGQSTDLKSTFNIIRKDGVFVRYIIAMTLCMVAYGQIDSTLVLHLSSANPEKGTWLFATLISINGLTIILFQFPLTSLFQKKHLYSPVKFGFVLLAVGFILFAVLPAQLMWVWWAAMIIFSFGEVIVFPNSQIFLDRIAPDHLRGSYFGAAFIFRTGRSFGTVLGGFILDYLGRTYLFIIIAGIVLLSLYFYDLSHKRFSG